MKGITMDRAPEISLYKGYPVIKIWTGRKWREEKDGYVLVKIGKRDPHTGFPTRWKAKHVVIWEQTHGPVPEGMAVVFKDGDKLNCDPDNLMLVSRAELLRLNHYHYREMPDDIKPSVLAMSKLEVKAFSLSKLPARLNRF